MAEKTKFERFLKWFISLLMFAIIFAGVGYMIAVGVKSILMGW